MKSFILISLILVGIIGMSGCDSNKPKTEIQTTSKIMETMMYQTDIKSDPLPVDAAAQMISNGLQEPFLGAIARRFGVGGFFDTSAFKITAPNEGIILWPCYNPRGENGHPKFFLVAEQVQQYDSLVNPHENNKPGKNLIMPIRVDQFNRSGNDHATAKADILQARNTTAGPTYAPIDAATTLKYVLKFEELMEDYSINQDTSFCEYGQYFFINNQYYKHFMGVPDLRYVYYYMGFAWDKYHKPNAYRPILVGIRVDGSTIEKNTKLKGGDPLLQKSVPPPPDN